MCNTGALALAPSRTFRGVAICTAALFSGGAALAYEICWSRALVVPLGNSADATALVLALTLMPVLAYAFLRRGVREKETLPIRWAKKAYRPLLRMVMARPMAVVLAAVGVFAVSLFVAGKLGHALALCIHIGREACAINAGRLTCLLSSSNGGNMEQALFCQQLGNRSLERFNLLQIG